MFRFIQFAMFFLLIGIGVSVYAQEGAFILCETTGTPVISPSIEVRALMVLNSLQTGDPTVAENYINPETYIQHNPGAPDGREGFLGLLSITGANPNSSVNTQRVLVSGNMVALHTGYNLEVFGGRLTAFDVFRFDDNGLIVEHWDNLQPVVDSNPGGRTAIDGSVIITDLGKSEENCRLVVDFVDTVLVGGGEGVDLTQYINPEMYLQHNTQIADGLDGLGVALQSLAENSQVLRYNQIELVVAQGNFVFIASEGVGGDADNPVSTAYFDLFRVENGLIVEHWDVISPIPPESEWQNENGKF